MLLLFITIISEYPLAQSAMNAAGWLGSNPEGLTSQSMQAGAIGLLLTLLLISVPPMAALFFNGTMGSFMHFSAWQNNSSPGPQGQPPGSYSNWNSGGSPALSSSSTGKSALPGNLAISTPSYAPVTADGNEDKIKNREN